MKTNSLKLANDLQVGDCWSLKTIDAREARRKMKTRTCAKSTGSVAQAGRPTPGRSPTHRGASDRQLFVGGSVAQTQGRSPKLGDRPGCVERLTSRTGAAFDIVFWSFLIVTLVPIKGKVSL